MRALQACYHLISHCGDPGAWTRWLLGVSSRLWLGRCSELHLKQSKRAGPMWTLYYTYSRMQEQKAKVKDDSLRVMTKQELWDLVRACCGSGPTRYSTAIGAGGGGLSPTLISEELIDTERTPMPRRPLPRRPVV